MKPKRWTLARVYAECWAAPVVWVALVELAQERGGLVVFPTREQLAKRTGITRLPTITAALRALESAAWIERAHKHLKQKTGGVATVLKVTLRHSEHLAFAMKTRAIANTRRSRHSEHVAFADSPTERGTPRAEGGGIPNNQRTPTVREIQERAEQRDKADWEKLLGASASKAGKAGSLPVGERNGDGTGLDTPAVF